MKKFLKALMFFLRDVIPFTETIIKAVKALIKKWKTF